MLVKWTWLRFRALQQSIYLYFWLRVNCIVSYLSTIHKTWSLYTVGKRSIWKFFRQLLVTQFWKSLRHTCLIWYKPRSIGDKVCTSSNHRRCWDCQLDKLNLCWWLDQTNVLRVTKFTFLSYQASQKYYRFTLRTTE